MTSDMEKLIITSDMTIEVAMSAIEAGSHKTVFLVEDGVLKGVLTDGDVRRYLLKGGSITDNVSRIVNYNPQYFLEGDKEDYREYMITNMLSAVPVVDDQMHLVRIEYLNSPKKENHIIEEDVPVIMMAGGLGTRLKPYTDIIPKPLIPIGTKTIAEHIFDKYISFGCNQLHMILNYKKGLIEAYFKESGEYEEIKFVEETFFMGTAGGIKLLQDICEKDFFVVNCDILVDCDYYEVWQEHCSKNNIITMVCAKKRITVPYGTIQADENNRVETLVEKPQLIYNINTGMYLCNSKIFEYMGQQEKIDMPDLIQRCIDGGERVGQVVIDEQDWHDMGQLEELELMKKRLNLL